MLPEHGVAFGGGASGTNLNPIVILALILAGLLILILPRKYVILPTLLMFFLVPTGEQLFLAGFHLYVYRIVILVGMVRMFGTKMTSATPVLGRMNAIDRAFLWCALCQACAVTVLFLTGSALVNQLGYLTDYLGGYFLLRFLIQDEDDVYRTMKCLMFLSFVVGACMLSERLTGHNVFALIGGQAAPETRDGVVRAQGPFDQELMAGAFGATLLPFCLILWKSEKAKALALLGVFGAVVMTYTSDSSTSVLAFAAAVVGVLFWPFRKSMRTVRWAIVGGLVALQLVMKAPIWYVIAHIDLTGGSSSYHRAELINQFIVHFFDWCVIGVRETGSWGLDMWDAQNQFVNVGTTGGLLALVLFIMMISRGFRALGNARRAVEGDLKQEWLYWLLGAALFSNVVAFFGVNYFDQTKFAWFALLAVVSAATAPFAQVSEAPEVLAPVAQRGPRSAPSYDLRGRCQSRTEGPSATEIDDRIDSYRFSMGICERNRVHPLFRGLVNALQYFFPHKRST